MRNKIVLWGTDAADARILVALELKIEENKVMIYTFSEALATDDFYQQMMDNWRNDKEEPVVFPEGHQAFSRELSITESILPEEIKVERTDLIQRAQTEWHFVVLSSKLSEAYRNELKELEEKLAGLKDYDKEIWGNLKNFWGKVQQQMRDRTLLREHADEIKARTNKAFDALKNLRSKMDDEFREQSKDNMQRFTDAIEDVEKRIKENTHLNKIFDELKRLQKDLRGTTFTKEHRNKLWQRIDNAFKDVKEKRFGDRSGGEGGNSGGGGGGGGNSPLDRITSRYNGLLNAIDKMERSIKRDEDDLAFQARQIDRTDGQLEAQIRQAKVQMIEQRVNSKKEKYEDMMKTKVQLEDKIEKEKSREAQRQAKQQEEAARREAEAKAKEKIAEDIRLQQEKLEQESGDQLASAAQAINEQKGGHKKIVAEPTPQEAPLEAEEAPKAKAAEPAEESLLDAIGATIGESLEDVVDTVKAIAEVVADKIDKKVDDIKEDINDLMKEEEE